MTNEIYPSSCGDYYTYPDWNHSNYQDQLSLITYCNTYLAVKDQKITSISLIDRIIHFVKGFFGFEDLAHQTKVNSELLKFVYYGAVNGLLPTSMLNQMKVARYSLDSRLSYPAMQDLIQGILNLQQAQSTLDKNRCLAQMQAVVIRYHYENASALRPHLWSRWFQQHQQFDSGQIRNFGDVPLILAKRALEGKQPNPVLALNHFLNAHFAHNHSQEFQKKFWKEFQEFLKTYRNDANIISKQFKIERVLFDMASMELARNNNVLAQEYLNLLLEQYPHDELIKLHIGEIYLNHKQHEKALPYFTLLQQHHPSQADIHEKIAGAYVALNQPEEAIKLYLKTLDFVKSQSDQKYGQINLEIGQLYLNKWNGLTEEESLTKALHYFTKAYKCNLTQAKAPLLQVYIKQRTGAPDQFEAIYGTQFNEFITKAFTHNVEEANQQKEIKAILLDCAEKTLLANRSDQAMQYVKTCLALFSKDPIFFDQILELGLKYQFSRYLINYFSEAYKSNHAHAAEPIKYLSQIYAKQWKHTPDQFEPNHGQEYLTFISRAAKYLSIDQQKESKAILMSCVKQAFENHHTDLGVRYLKEGLLFLFPDDPIFCYQLLDLSSKYSVSNQLLTQLNTIDTKFATNATIKKKIGDLHWENNHKWTAFKFYEQAASLYETQISKSTTDAERIPCKKNLAIAYYRMALNMMENPNSWIAIKWNTVIALLEKAINTANSEVEHKQALAQAYIAAGDEEARTFFNTNRDINTITYYAKAYRAYPKMDEYLKKLIEMYLNKSMDRELVLLYLDMQKRPDEVDMRGLPAILHSKIAVKLKNINLDEASIEQCIEQAYRLEPRNPTLKKDFCEMRHRSIAQKLDTAERIADNRRKIDALKAIENELQIVAKEDLSTLANIDKLYNETFSKMYQLLAEAYIQQFSYPKTISYDSAVAPGGHFEKHQAEIQETLRYYDLATKYDPNNASLHFDKGAIYSYVMSDDEKAIVCFEKAIKLNCDNPFYRDCLCNIYGFLHSLGRGSYQDRINELRTPIPEEYHLMLFNAYEKYKETRFSLENPKSINPHKYRIVYTKPGKLKSLFVSPQPIDVVVDA